MRRSFSPPSRQVGAYRSASLAIAQISPARSLSSGILVQVRVPFLSKIHPPLRVSTWSIRSNYYQQPALRTDCLPSRLNCRSAPQPPQVDRVDMRRGEWIFTIDDNIQIGIYMSRLAVLVMGLLLGVALATNPLVVIGDNQQHILDTESLAQHLEQQQALQGYIVEMSAMGADVVQATRKILQSANISQSQIDSFLMGSQEFNQALGPLAKKFQQVSVDELVKILLGKPEAVVYFRNHLSESRLLQEATNTNSLLFTNMTPSILSGLLVTLFLIIMIMIAVSCLYDIKTNDKYGRNNLWVGKES